MTLNGWVDTNWYQGKLNGREGLFPINYVEQLVDDDEEDDLSPVTSPLPISIKIIEIVTI